MLLQTVDGIDGEIRLVTGQNKWKKCATIDNGALLVLMNGLKLILMLSAFHLEMPLYVLVRKNHPLD